MKFPHPFSRHRIVHSPLCIVHCALCILYSAFILAPVPASGLEIQAHMFPLSCSWIDMNNGGGAPFWDGIVREHPSWFSADFTAAGQGTAALESGHQMAIVFNWGGFAVFIRFDCADEAVARGGAVDMYLSTDESAADCRAIPRHISILPAESDRDKMAENFFGPSVPIEARSSRPDYTKPRMAEERLPGGFAPTGPVNHEFRIQKSGDGKCWYLSAYFRWYSFGLELPFFPKTPRGTRWRFKLIRRAADGSRYVWGADERPFAGYGFIKWPGFPQDFRTIAYKQWISTGARGPMVRATDAAREYWGVSPAEACYGFHVSPEPTFQPREAASDTLFLSACHAPFFAKNNRMLDALVFTSEKGHAPAFDWPMEEKDRFFKTQTVRLYTVKPEIDEMRRRYVLDRLLGREVAPPQASKTSAKQSRPSPVAGDIDAPAGDAPAIELDDEAFF